MAEVWVVRIEDGCYHETLNTQDFYCATQAAAVSNAVRHLTSRVFPQQTWCDGDRQIELLSKIYATQQGRVFVNKQDERGNDEDWLVVNISRYKLLEE